MDICMDGGKGIKDETVNVLKSDYIFMFKLELQKEKRREEGVCV
jgi:hypothetical protein